MSAVFDANAIERHGWRQGAVLGPRLVDEARKRAPTEFSFADSDWLIVTSHDCDVVNWKLEKEPTVEVLRATVAEKRPDKQQVWGRNPREMHLEVDDGAGGSAVLAVKVHERWSVPRELLASEAPRCVLDEKPRRLIAEWLAKRYIRAAFPSSFDHRWRAKLKEWTKLLEGQSAWMQGIYVRLNTQTELDDDKPYKIHLIVAVPSTVKKDAEWTKKKNEMEKLIGDFWKQFGVNIECLGVEVRLTSALTLADIEKYQRFDADWLSFADDTPTTPYAVDMSS